jgi:hypothetical protein
MWCWRRTEKVSWADRVRKEVLHMVKERYVLHTIERRKAIWTGHILRTNCLLKHVIDGELEGRKKSDGKARKKKT